MQSTSSSFRTYKFTARVETGNVEFDVWYTISPNDRSFYTDNLAEYDKMVQGGLADVLDHCILLFMAGGLRMYAIANSISDQTQADWLNALIDTKPAKDLINGGQISMYNTVATQPLQWSYTGEYIDDFEALLDFTYPQGDLNFGFEVSFNSEDIYDYFPPIT